LIEHHDQEIGWEKPNGIEESDFFHLLRLWIG